MISDKFKNLVERKIDDLLKYKQSQNFKESVINARMAEINTMIDFYNYSEKFISHLQDEMNVISQRIIKAESENESLKRRLMFYHESAIIDGYEQSIHQLHKKISGYGYN